MLLEATISKMEIVQQEGSRQVKRSIGLYNLYAIISVGYRVNSRRATAFRIWATKILEEYMIKGFAVGDERLKQRLKAKGSELATDCHQLKMLAADGMHRLTDVAATE